MTSRTAPETVDVESPRSRTGQRLDWECGRRDKKTLTKMVDRLVPWDVQVYCTEKWATYASVIPQVNLVQSTTTTQDIARNDCRQRHWFGRVKRKSIIVSKALIMASATPADDVPGRSTYATEALGV